MKVIKASDSADFASYFNYDAYDVLKEPAVVCGDYSISKQYVKTKDGCWNFVRAVVTQLGSPVFDIWHDYRDLPHQFLCHPSGYDYLLIPNHYEHLALICLTTEEVKSYKDDHWCFALTHGATPCGRYVLLGGCYWGAPYTYRLYGVFGGELVLVQEWDIIWEEDDKQEVTWGDGYVDIPVFATEGRDGLEDEEGIWNTGNYVRNDADQLVWEENPDNVSFSPDGDYSEAYKANFGGFVHRLRIDGSYELVDVQGLNPLAETPYKDDHKDG